jgi:hypothetical protein
MAYELPQRDPIAAYTREATAARIGGQRQCACGEARLWALIRNSDPAICAKCQRKVEGQSIYDDHHVADKANNSTTLPIPVNDHRAELTKAQYDWPKQTRENPKGSPLLALAACIRGFADTVVYLLRKLLLPNAEFCEILDTFLAEKLGPYWWVKTPLERFAPKR